MRWAAKVDQSQTDIVDGLRKLGCKVYVIREPCDLLVRYYDPRLIRWMWQTLECKTPTKTGKRRKRTDQDAQEAFLADTQTPVVLNLSQAIEALGLS